MDTDRGTSSALCAAVRGSSSLIVLSVIVIGCHARPADGTDAAPSADATPSIDAASSGGTCNALVTHETPLMAASHVPQGSVVAWNSNPPSSGPHYPTLEDWAQAYPVVVARGNYLHNEEHGGVVLLYNCSAGCGTAIQDLAAFGKALPQDPACPTTMNARWIMTSDPLLPAGVQVAAATWGWTYKAQCFDAATLGAFVAAHYAQGGSDRTNCTDGVPAP